MENGKKHTRHCLLCNRMILDTRDFEEVPNHYALDSRFRTVFTTPDSLWTKAHLSDAARDVAWDNGIPGYNSANNRRTHYWRELTNSAQWEVADSYCYFQECVQNGQAQNIVWVFPFHEKCWDMLEDAAQYLDIPLNTQAIYDVALTFHFEDTWLIYRAMRIHFEPLLYIPTRDVSYGLDTFTPTRPRNWSQFPYPSGSQSSTNLRVSKVQRITAAVDKGVRLMSAHNLANAHSDPFKKLPPEIHQAIFEKLLPRDVGNLRVASRWCGAVAISSSFLRAQMDPHGSLGYVLKLADPNPNELGRWRCVYDRALLLSGFPELDHRKIPWTAAVDLMDLVKLRLEAPDCHGASGFHPKGGKLRSSRPPRVTLHFYLRGEDPGAQHHRWLEISKPLQKVEVSTMDFHEKKKFITGLSFHYQDGTSDEIGYIHPQAKVTAWTSERARARRINRISVLTDHMGVRGIRLHHTGPWMWAGDARAQEARKRTLTFKSFTFRPRSQYAGRFIEAAFYVSYERT